MGPRPGIRPSSTKSGGYFRRRSSSFEIVPDEKNSRIFFAVLVPMPPILVSSFSERACRSPRYEEIASIAFS